MTEKTVRSYCRNCNQDTNHNIAGEKVIDDLDDYPATTKYQITQCKGCDSYSFRQVYIDHTVSYPTDEEGSEWVTPEDVNIYPKFIRDHHSQIKTYYLPVIVRNIYIELLEAIRSDAKILAGLGLRACIEAVSNDLKIDGRTLEIRINKLSSSGFISKKDAERLHGIRFMGNDAAHEIKIPKKEGLSVALKIVEHLLLSVYILERESDGNLDATISDYPIFEKLLESKLSGYKIGDEFPLAQYLGRDLRRVSNSISSIETELIAQIQTEKYKKLSLGKVNYFKNSKDMLQHFIVAEVVENVLNPFEDFDF